MNGTLTPAQVVPQGQMMPAQMPSSLAAAMMGRMGAGTPNLQNPIGQIPLSSIMQMQMMHNMQNPKAANRLSNLTNGIGHLFSGFNGMGCRGLAMLAICPVKLLAMLAGGAAL